MLGENWADHLDALIKEPEISVAIPISISLIIGRASNGTEISIQKTRNENSCRCLAPMRSLWRWTHVTAVCHTHIVVFFFDFKSAHAHRHTHARVAGRSSDSAPRLESKKKKENNEMVHIQIYWIAAKEIDTVAWYDSGKNWSQKIGNSKNPMRDNGGSSFDDMVIDNE